MTAQFLPRPEIRASLLLRSHSRPVVLLQAAGRTIHFSCGAELVPGALLDLKLRRGEASACIRVQIQRSESTPSEVGSQQSYQARIITTSLPDWLSWQLDTRSAFRVDAEPAEEIAVKLTLGGQRLRGCLLDASQDGVAVLCRVTLETASQLGVHAELELDLLEGKVKSSAHLRRLKGVGSQCRMGFELMDDGSLDYRRMRSVLRSYVMRRQRELVQSRVER